VFHGDISRRCSSGRKFEKTFLDTRIRDLRIRESSREIHFPSQYANVSPECFYTNALDLISPCKSGKSVRSWIFFFSSIFKIHHNSRRDRETSKIDLVRFLFSNAFCSLARSCYKIRTCIIIIIIIDIRLRPINSLVSFPFVSHRDLLLAALGRVVGSIAIYREFLRFPRFF